MRISTPTRLSGAAESPLRRTPDSLSLSLSLFMCLFLSLSLSLSHTHTQTHTHRQTDTLALALSLSSLALSLSLSPVHALSLSRQITADRLHPGSATAAQAPRSGAAAAHRRQRGWPAAPSAHPTARAGSGRGGAREG